MTTTTLTSISTAQENEGYPARRLRFAASDVFQKLVAFMLAHPEPIGFDSVGTMVSPNQLLAQHGIDFMTAEDLDFFVSTLSDTTLPGAEPFTDHNSKCGTVSVRAFKSYGLYVHIVECDRMAVCVANRAGAVEPYWSTIFEPCNVPTAITL